MLDLPGGRVRLPGRQLRELRRLAAQGRPHPDRDVRRRAVAWARNPALSPGRTAAIVVTGTLGTAALVVGAYYRVAVPIVLLGLPLTLVAAALAAGPPRAALVHKVNLAALLDDMAVPARPLEVVGRGRRRPHQLSVSGVLVADAVAGALARAYTVTLFCLVVAVVAFAVGRMRDKPALPVRLDETGLRLSGGAVGVPWTGVDAVELASTVDPYLLVVRWRLPAQTPPPGRGTGDLGRARGGRAALARSVAGPARPSTGDDRAHLARLPRRHPAHGRPDDALALPRRVCGTASSVSRAISSASPPGSIGVWFECHQGMRKARRTGEPMTTGRATELRRKPEDPQQATFLELFFDLVFVLALAQLSRGLIEQLTWGRAFQTLVLLLALWWVWVFTAGMTDLFEPRQPPIQLVVTASMLGSLVLAAVTPQAFGRQGLVFAGAYLAIQLGRSVFVLLVEPSREVRRLFLRQVVIFLAAAADGLPRWLRKRSAGVYSSRG